ncbi:sensor histidine kinase [Acidovorax lacteus]|uniref:histidine kinase n=1 Tax=Acidovorax lacteus TaxID=1924988 RepID=A0ABP8LD85_9BURK
MNTAAFVGRPAAPRLAERLTRSLLWVLAAVWLASIVGVSLYLNRQINRNFDHELEESAHRMMEAALYQVAAQGEPTTPQPLLAAEPLFDSTPLVYQLVRTPDRVLLRSQHAPVQPFAVPLRQGYYNVKDWRVYVAQHPQEPLYLLLADPLAERSEALQQALFTLLLAAVVVLSLLAWLLRRVAERELRVLGQLQAQIGQRGGRDLSALHLADLPLELRAVGEDINRLLARLAEALDVERALAANAAHELRTPLAAATLRLQTALDQGGPQPDVQAAVAALRTLAQRTEKLLQLSRAESGAAWQRVPVPLDALASTVAQEFWHASDDARRRLDLVLADEPLPPVWGDPDTLAIAVRNLIENALRYSAGAAVTLEVRAPAQLCVHDQGPGVDAERLRTLRERHVRHARDQAGYGLGLSITSTIVARHGGQLTLASPPAGQARGFEACIALPSVPGHHGASA